VGERRRLRGLEHELRKLDKLFDPNLFLAQLRQPKPVATKTAVVVLGRKDLKRVIDELDRVPKVLMDIERFFREELASKTAQIDIKDIPQLVNKIDGLIKEALSVWEPTLYAHAVFSQPGSPLRLLLTTQTKESEHDSENIDDVLLTLSQALWHIMAVLTEFRNYLVTSHNLFSDTALAVPGAVSKTGMELIKGIERSVSPDLAREADKYLIRIGLAVLDPQTANIRFGRTRVLDVLRRISEVLNDLNNRFKPFMNNEAVSEFIETITRLGSALNEMVIDAQAIVYDCLALKYLSDKLNLGYKAPSERCAFFLEPPPSELPEELTFTLFFNDIAYAVHRIAEMAIHLNTYIKKALGIENTTVFKLDKCNIPLYSTVESGALFNFATAWLNTICQLAAHRWVTPDDLNPLAGYIVNDTTAWFRVGSAAMHATHVTKEGDTWVIRYYDNDEPVNTIISKLWSAVPNTEVEVTVDGVIARTKDEKALPFIGALLGFATSMDLNLEYFGRNIRDRMIQLAEKVSPQLALIVKKALGA
jgi:hypothetical protein